MLANTIGWDSLGLGGLLGLALLLLCGGILHGMLGVGFPLVTTPVLSLFADLRRVMLLLLIPTLSVNLTSIVRGGDWRQQIRRFFPLALWGVCGSALGSFLLASVDPEPFKLILAVAILVYLQASRFGQRLSWVKGHQGVAMAIFGLVGGFLAGTVNVMVPALIIFALESKLPMRSMVQIFNLCFLLGKLTQALAFVQVGLLTLPLMLQTLPLAAITLVGLAIGFKLQKRVSPDTYRRALIRLLYAMAILLTVQGGVGLLNILD